MLALAAAVFYLAPWGFVYVPALLVAAYLIWLRLDLGLALVLVFSPLFMVPKHIGSTEFAPSEIFLIVDGLVAAALIAQVPRRGVVLGRALLASPFLLPAGLFLVAATLSTLGATERHLALRGYRLWVAEPLLWAVLLVLVEDSLARWRIAFLGLLGAGLLVGAIGAEQLVTQQNLTQVTGASISRVKATYGSPDNLGLLYDRVLPVWLAFGLWTRLRGWWRLGWALLGALYLVILFFTFSRGAWVAVAVAFALLLSARFGWGRWAVMVAAVLLGAALIVKGPAIVDAFRSGHSNTVQRRLDIWRSSLRMIRDHPLLGIGPDNFQHYYAPSNDPYSGCAPGLNYMEPGAAEEPCLSHPHNVILDFWLSSGVVGLIAFLWLQAVFWRHGLRLARERERNLGTALLFGSLAAMAASLIHGLVDNTYFLNDLSVIFWTLCAYVGFLAVSGASEATHLPVAAREHM